MKISKSPDRFSFQKNSYIQRCEDMGKKLSQNYLDMFDRSISNDNIKFLDPESRINNIEYDLRTTEWILEKTRNSEIYAQNLYAALCNNDFIKNEVWPLLKGETNWSCSWRYAGGVIAHMCQKGDYIDWYCSGIQETYTDEEIKNLSLNKEHLERYEITKKFVPEGTVTDEIHEDLLKLGWTVVINESF